MSKLLISVRNGQEAMVVTRFPVGILDLKDPDSGALGMASHEDRAEFLANVLPGLKTSIALGELVDLPHGQCSQGTQWDWLRSFQFAKIGLANVSRQCADWRLRWAMLNQAMPSATTLVGVAYADWASCGAPSIEEIFDLVRSNSTGAATEASALQAFPSREPVVLLDTHRKTNGNLVELLGWLRIEALIELARSRQVKLVLAGSLQLSQLEALFKLEPDYIGLRGAVCDVGRARLSEKKLAELFKIWNRLQHKPCAQRCSSDAGPN